MVHGSATGQQVMMQNGVVATDIASTGFVSPLLMNPTGAAEVVIDTSAASAEHNAGGVRINVITRDGGNTFNGSMFMGFTTSALQSSNFDDRLRDLGITTSDSVKSIYDVNPGFGGPIKRDRLWFYASLRWNGNENYAAGSFFNRNANNPNAWTFDPDPSRPLTNNYDNRDGQVRFTFQATQRNKVGFVFHDQGSCFCQGTISPVTSLEASIRKTYPVQRSLQADWTAPITTRLLLEAGGNSYFARTHWGRWPGLDSNMIAVQEQSSGLWYRSGGGGTLAAVPEHAQPRHPLARRAVVHHRHAQPEGRVQPLQRVAEAAHRKRPADVVPLQQRRAEPDHDAGVAVSARRGDQPQPWRVRAGSVDARRADAQLRPPVRLHLGGLA